MNNSLFTQIFTRLKPVKHLASLVLLARLKNSASLSALILATLLLAACGGGGGGSSSGGGSPATTVTNFKVVPAPDRMTLSWTNPNRADIASINLSWAAYAANDLSRDTAGDGYLIISNSNQTAAAAANEYNITTLDKMSVQNDVGDIADGFVIGGATLDTSSAYVFSVQLYFNASGNSTTAAAPQSPDITAPRVPRELGANPDADSFADTQVYSVGNPLSTSDGGNVTLSWINPRVGAGNIASIRVSYVNNNSMTDFTLLRDTAHTATDGLATTYIWTGLEPGLYNFTIAPTLGGIFTGIEVAPGMTDTEVFPPAAVNQLAPDVTIDPADTVAGLFPDDGDVQYILTITQQDNITNPMLRVRPLVDNSNVCSIALTSAIPSYISNGIVNQTSATYNVTGTAAGGTCNIDFQITEDGRSVRLSRSITFNAELPPLLIPQIFEDRVLRPANLNLSLDIIASKQDDSNTPDVTFPAVVTSSSTPSCTATLIGSGADMPRQYTADANGTVSAAISTATATYNVSSPGLVPVADCGTFHFAVTEGSATVTTPLNPGISFDERNDMPLAPTVTTDPVGAITDVFPDDGAVSYTLNLAKRDILTEPAVPVVNTTASITTGTCNIVPTGVTPLTYDADNQTNTDYAITYTGTATEGGTCTVSFVATEDGEATTITRRITFNPELAPDLGAELLDSGTGVSSIELVRVNVTATKQDAGENRGITFPASVVSAACTATLDGDVAREYVMNVTSAVTVTYNVRPTIRYAAASCGSFIFTATEGPATGTLQFPSGINFVVGDFDGDGLLGDDDNCPLIATGDQTDTDGDDVGDPCDVDDDGDGLIEIYNATQLNMMRNNLGSTSLKANADATGNSDGCGGGMAVNGTAITTCNGYEQMADIDLNDLPKDAAGSNWQPVGTCGNGFRCDSSSGAQFFSGIFSGNNFTISNLLIHITTTSYGVGFFGAIAPNAELRNVHIRGGNITRAAVTSQYLGGLVGHGHDTTISNSSVILDEISGTVRVAGLVGSGDSATVRSSVATVGSVSGEGQVGGLIGSGGDAIISSSLATAGSISGTFEVGGLIGFGGTMTISSSIATVGSISGTRNVGGLVGDGISATISSSVATVGSVSGTSNVGGLAGSGNGATISSSAATAGSVSGTSESVGGLVGFGEDATINSSVATVGTISGPKYVGGLLGWGDDSTIISSVAVTNSITGTTHVGGLAGASGIIFGPNRDPSSVTASYWDSNVSFASAMPLASNTAGSAQTTAALQSPTVFTGTDNIYTTWANAWCNPATGEFITDSSSPLAIDANRVWDLGTGSQYPAITCAKNLFPLSEQRAATARVIAGESPLVD